MLACNEARKNTSISLRVVSDMGWLALGKELIVSVKSLVVFSECHLGHAVTEQGESNEGA